MRAIDQNTGQLDWMQCPGAEQSRWRNSLALTSSSITGPEIPPFVSTRVAGAADSVSPFGPYQNSAEIAAIGSIVARRQRLDFRQKTAVRASRNAGTAVQNNAYFGGKLGAAIRLVEHSNSKPRASVCIERCIGVSHSQNHLDTPISLLRPCWPRASRAFRRTLSNAA
jgi:hypothetical protein